MRSKRHNGQRERKFRSLSHLRRVKLDAYLRATRVMVDNDESGIVAAAQTIVVSSHLVVVLDQSVPF